MGLFGNNNEDPNNNHSRSSRRTSQHSRRGHDASVEPKHSSVPYGEEERFNPVVGGCSYNKAPTFGQWIRGAALDILTLLTFGALALGLYFVRPTPRRDFPVNYQDGSVVNADIALPVRKEIIPIWAAALIAVLAPMFVVILASIRVQSFWDVNNAFFGILYAVVSAAVIQTVIKVLIGGFSPNFLEVCQPLLPEQPNGVNVGNGFRQIFYSSGICTGNAFAIARALEAFPDGKTTSVVAGMVFLFLYLNAKLKVMSNFHPAMWKLILLLAPLLGAIAVSSTNTIDHYHSFTDMIVGAIIGTLTAFISYRMVYAAIWDFRFNHIPLNRSIPCAYGSHQCEATKTTITHRAGWDEAVGTFGGAPWDTMAHNAPQVISLSKLRGDQVDGSGHAHQVGPMFDGRRDLEQGRARDTSPARAPLPMPAGTTRATPTVTVEEVSRP